MTLRLGRVLLRQTPRKVLEIGPFSDLKVVGCSRPSLHPSILFVGPASIGGQPFALFVFTPILLL